MFRQFVEWWTASYPQTTTDRPGIPAGPEILHKVEAQEDLKLSAVTTADEWPNWVLIDVLDLD
jgi:hypothetical protein